MALWRMVTVPYGAKPDDDVRVRFHHALVATQMEFDTLDIAATDNAQGIFGSTPDVLVVTSSDVTLGRVCGASDREAGVSRRGRAVRAGCPALRGIIAELRAGNEVTVMSSSAVLTTAEAAELLNVSRPHVVKLVDGGSIPHHMAGLHRRLTLADLLAYKTRRTRRAGSHWRRFNNSPTTRAWTCSQPLCRESAHRCPRRERPLRHHAGRPPRHTCSARRLSAALVGGEF